MPRLAASKNVISKSQYLKGLQCKKALWLYRHRKELATPFSKETEQRLATGHNIGELAKQYFLEQGPTVEVQAPFWDVESGVRQTRSFLAEGENIIFEATAAAEQTYSRIDVLRRMPYGQIELIEVKATSKVKPYHIEDMAFQYYVFCSAEYSISACYMMLIDTSYVRQDELELGKLFQLCDISSSVLARQRKVLETSSQFSQMLSNYKREPQVAMGKHCSKPFECEYAEYCLSLRERPRGELFAARSLDEISAQTEMLSGGFIEESKVKKQLNESRLPRGYQVRSTILQRWINQLHYPLYFLDYECFQSPLPLFNQSRPYQPIPFQFSLHIQFKEGAQLKHISFLSKEYMNKNSNNNSTYGAFDPRLYFIQSLLQNCGNQGSIVVYNQTFESFINKSLARDFPTYRRDLLDINSRMKDLQQPFKKRWLYSPQQEGSTSLKSALAAFTSFSYQELAIANGFDAMNTYLDFLLGSNQKHSEQLLADLEEYNKMDTLALSLLLEAIQQLANQWQPAANSSSPSSGLELGILY